MHPPRLVKDLRKNGHPG